jgi:hypothetical protein
MALFLLCPNLGWIQGQFNFTELSLRYLSNRACNKIEPVKENIFTISARNALQAGEVPAEMREDLLEYVASKQIQAACRNLAAGRPDIARENLKDCKTRHLWKSKYWTLFWAYVPSEMFSIFKKLKTEIRSRINRTPMA